MVQEVFPKFCKVVIIEFPEPMSERVSLFVQRAMLLALLLQDQTQRTEKNVLKLFYSLILKDIGKDEKKTFRYFIGKKQKVIGSNCYRKKGKH